jgi:hypothetical protein
MSKSLLFLGLLVTSLAVCGSASLANAAADMTPRDRSLVISTLDTSGHDGTLSLKEVDAAAKAKFTTLDTDSDGTLDASELTGIITHSQLAAADKDKDGTLDKAEYLALTKAMFEAADGDHDGTVNAVELSTPKGIDLVALLAY